MVMLTLQGSINLGILCHLIKNSAAAVGGIFTHKSSIALVVTNGLRTYAPSPWRPARTFLGKNARCGHVLSDLATEICAPER